MQHSEGPIMNAPSNPLKNVPQDKVKLEFCKELLDLMVILSLRVFHNICNIPNLVDNVGPRSCEHPLGKLQPKYQIAPFSGMSKMDSTNNLGFFIIF